MASDDRRKLRRRTTLSEEGEEAEERGLAMAEAEPQGRQRGKQATKGKKAKEKDEVKEWECSIRNVIQTLSVAFIIY